MKSATSTVCRAAIYLSACALNGLSPSKEYLEGIDTDAVYAFSARHSIGTLVCSSLEKLGLARHEAIANKNSAIRKIMLFNAERTEILSTLEREGIKYMPLKGVYLKEMYPSIGDREMSDNDILFDISARKRVREIMTERGYKTESYNQDNDDVYIKPPVYNFEMHVSLFADELDDSIREYFEKAFDRAEKLPGTDFGYRMSDADFYIYQKAHEYKHYANSGVGIRALTDTYVMLCTIGDAICSEYTRKELEKLGILNYEREVCQLSEKLLSRAFAENPPESLSDILTEKEIELLRYMATSGTYGNKEREVENRLKRNTEETGSERRAKRKMLREKLFPPMSYYKSRYPFFYRHKYLIPFFVIWRFIKTIFTRPIAACRQLARISGSKTGKSK